MWNSFQQGECKNDRKYEKKLFGKVMSSVNVVP